MKKLFSFLLPILLISSCAMASSQKGSTDSNFSISNDPRLLLRKNNKYVPTPARTLTWSPGNNDTRQWEMQFLDGDTNGILCEFVPKGDYINQWREMLAQQIVFTNASVQEFAGAWKARLEKIDPALKEKQTDTGDGSIIIDFHSPSADEIGVKKILKGPDGIYMLTYSVRSAFKSEVMYKLWTEIITASTLIPNPEPKRQAGH